MHQRCYDSSFLILAQHAAERVARGRHHTPLREQRGGEGASGGAAVAAAPILQQETLARGHSATYQTDFWFCLHDGGTPILWCSAARGHFFHTQGTPHFDREAATL